jgi:hypothetical protein
MYCSYNLEVIFVVIAKCITFDQKMLRFLLNTILPSYWSP